MSEIIKDTDDLTIESLKDRNPRLMRDHKDAALGGSMDKWGDLGGITYNMQTSRYVTGHQRMRKLKQKYGDRVKIYVEQKFAEPDEFGTVGLGHVGVDGTNVRFAYREVMFSEGDEYAAGVAANNATGENDKEMLAQIDYELSQLENGDELLALTGQEEDEIVKLLQSVGVEPEGQEDEQPAADDEESDKLTFAMTRDQRLIVERAVEHVKQTRELQAISSPSLNGAALFVLASDYLDRNPEPELNVTSQNTDQPSDELTDIPA